MGVNGGSGVNERPETNGVNGWAGTNGVNGGARANGVNGGARAKGANVGARTDDVYGNRGAETARIDAMPDGPEKDAALAGLAEKET